MAATITAVGTWSTIAASEEPVAHRDTVEERYDYESVVYEDALKNNQGGFPELEQFIALMSAGYGISAKAAGVRMERMLTIRNNRSRTPEERSYTP